MDTFNVLPGTGRYTGGCDTGTRPRLTPTINFPRFIGRPQFPSDQTIDQWLADFDVFVRQCDVSEGRSERLC